MKKTWKKSHRKKKRRKAHPAIAQLIPNEEVLAKDLQDPEFRKKYQQQQEEGAEADRY